MNKGQLLKHLQRVAAEASGRKRLNGIHVRVIVDELQSVWAKSLQEKGSASLKNFGRFDVQKGKGTIKFTPARQWKEKISGEISSSADVEGASEDEDFDDDASDSDDEDKKR